MAYLNAWLTSFVGYTLLCSLLEWTTRGRHHSPVSVCLTVWPLHRDFSLLFCEKWSGFFYVHRVWLSYTQDRRLKVSSERLGNEDKAPCQRGLLPTVCRGGIWTHAEPPVWKFAVYTLALRPLGHNSSSISHDSEYNTKLHWCFLPPCALLRSSIESLPVRIEALQVLTQLVKGYFHIIRGLLNHVTLIVTECLLDRDSQIQLHSLKVKQKLPQILVEYNLIYAYYCFLVRWL